MIRQSNLTKYHLVSSPHRLPSPPPLISSPRRLPSPPPLATSPRHLASPPLLATFPRHLSSPPFLAKLPHHFSLSARLATFPGQLTSPTCLPCRQLRHRVHSIGSGLPSPKGPGNSASFSICNPMSSWLPIILLTRSTWLRAPVAPNTFSPVFRS